MAVVVSGSGGSSVAVCVAAPSQSVIGFNRKKRAEPCRIEDGAVTVHILHWTTSNMSHSPENQKWIITMCSQKHVCAHAHTLTYTCQIQMGFLRSPASLRRGAWRHCAALCSRSLCVTPRAWPEWLTWSLVAVAPRGSEATLHSQCARLCAKACMTLVPFMA